MTAFIIRIKRKHSGPSDIDALEYDEAGPVPEIVNPENPDEAKDGGVIGSTPPQRIDPVWPDDVKDTGPGESSFAEMEGTARVFSSEFDERCPFCRSREIRKKGIRGRTPDAPLDLYLCANWRKEFEVG